VFLKRASRWRLLTILVSKRDKIVHHLQIIMFKLKAVSHVVLHSFSQFCYAKKKPARHWL